MLPLRLLPERHSHPRMFPNIFGRLRYPVPFFPMPMLFDFPLGHPTIISSGTEVFSIPLFLACY
jgi:hypothetical protein